MSFYTSLCLYRPGKPPSVTGPTVARVVGELLQTGLFERRGAEYFRIKFGTAIDQDALGTFVEVPDLQHSLISTFRSIDWDIRHDNVIADNALALLSNHDRAIYRAAINLGRLRDDIVQSLQTPRPDDGAMNLHLSDCSFDLGPVEIGTIESEERIRAGWMEVSFSGNGYLRPWTVSDLISRAASSAPLKSINEICRRHFPGQQNGWRWGVSETG